MRAWRIDEAGRLQPAGEVAGPVTIVWVPTEQVSFFTVTVPGRREREWRRALPWALEEQLAQPVEAVHVQPLHRVRDGTTHCAVVARATLAAWQAAVAEKGLSRAILVPDCFRLPLPDGPVGWQGWQTADRVLVRTGAWSGLAASTEHWPALHRQAEAPPVSWLSRTPEAPSVEQLLPRALSRLQAAGDRRLRTWMMGAGGLMVLAVGLLTLDRWLEARWMMAQADAWRAQTEALFRKAFPDVKRLVNLRAQVRQRLSADSNVSVRDPFGRLAQLDAAVAALGIQVERVVWDGRRWQVTVRADTMERLERLQTRLGDGVRLEVAQVRAGDVRGQVYVDVD